MKKCQAVALPAGTLIWVSGARAGDCYLRQIRARDTEKWDFGRLAPKKAFSVGKMRVSKRLERNKLFFCRLCKQELE
jgi:hypothetical protein